MASQAIGRPHVCPTFGVGSGYRLAPQGRGRPDTEQGSSNPTMWPVSSHGCPGAGQALPAGRFAQ